MKSPIDILIEGLQNDINEAVKNEDARISNNQNSVALTLLIQYVVFFALIFTALVNSNQSYIPMISSAMISLGVVGIALARRKTGNLKKIYEDAYVGGDITQLKTMVLALKGYITADDPAELKKIDDEIRRYDELGHLREKTKYSLRRLEISTDFLWISEL